MKIKSLSQSAFLYPRLLVGVLLCFASVALAFFAFHSAIAQGNPPTPVIKGVYRGLAPVVKFDISPRLSDMEIIPPGPGKIRENEEHDILPFKIRFAPEWDPVVQRSVARGGFEIPGPIVSFNGQPNTSGVAPPDPNGDVGPNHVVTMANLSFQIFNKTGTSLFGPAANNTLWAGFGGPCQNENAGDPVVLYDQLANRWFLSQFTGAGPNFFFCVAISQTPDPTGAYFRYAISTGTNFPDYPKAGVWPDAYYISTREFSAAGPFAGVGAYALNRAQAIAGNPAAQVISMIAPPGATPYNVGDGLLPSDLDGATLPPAGSPNYFVGSMDNNGPYGAPQDALTLWKFVANFPSPGLSTFTLTNTIPVAPFNSILGICAGRACIPQPGTTNRIDHLGYRQRPLHRLAYRNFGTHESLVTNQSVSGGTGPNGEVSGIRWWELRSPNAAPVIFQQGTYAPGVTDGIHRWMGSIAMDGQGNMGLAYSASNGTSPSVFPSVFYTGRGVGDPLGTMTGGENSIFNGTGSQTAGGNRWGDYTSISLDPNDDLTFWVVNEYVPITSGSGWQLRVGSFTYGPAVPTNVLSSGGRSIVSAGPNGVLDPGEVVTVSLGARNTGGPGVICTTAALTGTLQATGGVTAPSGPQNYGALCSGSPSVFRNFTFTVDPALACGSTVTASLVMTDGVANYGTFTYTFVTGSPSNVAVENFDGVVAPALPAGWTTTFSGTGTAVTTSNVLPDTAPNDIFLSEASNVGLSEVTSANIAITGAGQKISFRNLFNTEPGFDGLVLEISIAGGAFQDILAAGGTFATGGYNSTLPTTFANPLPNRMAWTGLSGGTAAAPTYITTVVNLPAAAVGQNIQLKWRQGSDNSVLPAVNPGSRIDTILRTATICGGSAPVPSSVVSRKLHGVTPFDITMPLSGLSGVEDRRGTGAGLNNHQLRVTFATPVTVDSVTVTSNDGLATATHSISGSVVTVDLAAVADAQVLTVALNNTSDGVNVGSINIPMGILLGDTNGDRFVNTGDTLQTRGRAGQLTDATNFRSDVNESGDINAGDTTIVRGRSGNALP